LSSGGDVCCSGGPPSLPHFEPVNPLPGWPGAPRYPNGSPFGDADYKVRHLTGDWYSFQAAE